MIFFEGTAGNSSDQLNNAYGITRDSSSNTLYVADYGNHRVMSYASGASSGTLTEGNGTSGISITQLSYPTGLYFDSPSNSLVIDNYGANNIVRWSIGASSWTLVGGSMSGLSGNTSVLLNHPLSVKLDPMGNIYVADMLNHRIQLFLVGESDAITIAGVTGVSGSNSTLLYRPYSLALDNQLNLYVTDTFNHRVQRFFRY
jgi:sugar lactone lactonase YvrE